ncbi:hypothetical protein CERZMDRAFT_84370 [Cercospora zeae-maydis SCOH1-5]|uniref:Uncharacterized protein n=1 Tax=Cercospora zeae-maydis SCOH1-5 TaxID=717836 RepID=A0A6A6FH47_9PEZI|nr:hypothetical protein CERZMDRAFT_84370 [Cercospora zeae-maydis SCOH1-5]
MAQEPTTKPTLTGRGGAGNLNARPSPKLQSSDLETPTIKTTTYTTGRGGSGNMAKNNPASPEESRLAQDVDTPAHHNKEMQGTYHWGRGGEGNMTTLGKSGAQQAREKGRDKRMSRGEEGAEKMNSNGGAAAATAGRPAGSRSGSFTGMVNKGKELLGLTKEKNTHGNGKSHLSKENESAIE